jgi:hypothetical protein
MVSYASSPDVVEAEIYAHWSNQPWSARLSLGMGRIDQPIIEKGRHGVGCDSVYYLKLRRLFFEL